MTAKPDCPAICQVHTGLDQIIDAAIEARDLGYCTVEGMISTWLPLDQRTAPDIDALDLHNLHAMNTDIAVLAQLETAIGRDLSDNAPWLANWIDAAPALAKRADATRHLLPDAPEEDEEAPITTPLAQNGGWK